MKANKNIDDFLNSMLSGCWPDPIHQQFADQAKAAGFKVHKHSGPFLYLGPAVTVKDNDEFSEFMKRINTDIKLKWDHMGKTGRVIYPR